MQEEQKPSRTSRHQQEEAPTLSHRHPRLIKALKWVAIIAAVLLAIKLSLMLISFIVSLIVNVISWVAGLFMNLVGILVLAGSLYLVWFSKPARAWSKRRRAKDADWQKRQLSRLGIGNTPKNTANLTPRRFNRHVYDERSGTYRDVTVDHSGHVIGESGQVSGDRLKR